MFSNLKEVDEVVEAALEPHMEIRENENENETGNNKLVVAQDVNWGEDDFYSGEEEFSNKPMPKWYRVILRESNAKGIQSDFKRIQCQSDAIHQEVVQPAGHQRTKPWWSNPSSNLVQFSTQLPSTRIQVCSQYVILFDNCTKFQRASFPAMSVSTKPKHRAI